jgi:hypothetical protein
MSDHAMSRTLLSHKVDIAQTADNNASLAKGKQENPQPTKKPWQTNHNTDYHKDNNKQYPSMEPASTDSK